MDGSSGLSFGNRASGEFLIENLLWAGACGLGDAGFIQEKNVTLEVITTPVPEPQAYALAFAGLGALGWFARRRRPNES